MAGQMDFKIPIGYRFAPSDQEIISFYLMNLATKQPMPSNAVVEKNVYESEPWNIFSDKDEWVSMRNEESKNKYMYVYTRVTYVSESIKNNISRKAGQGSWSGKSKLKSITNDSGKVIGYMRSLTYKADVNNEENRKSLTKRYGHWMMHEYMVEEKKLPKNFEGPCNIVICKIIKQESEVSSKYDSSEVAITSGGDVANKRESPSREEDDDRANNNKRLTRGSIDKSCNEVPQQVEWLQQQLPSTSLKVDMPNFSYANYHTGYPVNQGASSSQYSGFIPSQFQPSIPHLAVDKDGCIANGITNVGEFPYPIRCVPDQYIPTYQPVLEENFEVGSSSRALPPHNVTHDGIGYDEALMNVMRNIDVHFDRLESGNTYLKDGFGLTDLDLIPLLYGNSVIEQSCGALPYESIGGSCQIGHDLQIPVAVNDGLVDCVSGNVISQLPVDEEGNKNNIDFHALKRGAKYGEEASVLVDFASLVSNGSTLPQPKSML